VRRRGVHSRGGGKSGENQVGAVKFEEKKLQSKDVMIDPAHWVTKKGVVKKGVNTGHTCVGR